MFNHYFARFDFFQKQNRINIIKIEDKKEEFNIKIAESQTLLEKHTNNFEMMRNIDKMRKEIFQIEENVKSNQYLIEMIKKIISQKQNDIQLCSSILNMCKDNYKEKKNNVELEKFISIMLGNPSRNINSEKRL